MDDYYSSLERRLWDFFLGFFGAIAINVILWIRIVVVQDIEGGMLLCVLICAIEFVVSWGMANSKRRYIFIGALVVLVMMLLLFLILLPGSCFAIFQ
jgi:hypothetical protein